MKKILKIIFGSKMYCKLFHVSYGTKDNKWYCKKCNIIRNKRLSDNDSGPR